MKLILLDGLRSGLSAENALRSLRKVWIERDRYSMPLWSKRSIVRLRSDSRFEPRVRRLLLDIGCWTLSGLERKRENWRPWEGTISRAGWNTMSPFCSSSTMRVDRSLLRRPSWDATGPDSKSLYNLHLAITGGGGADFSAYNSSVISRLSGIVNVHIAPLN